VPQRRAMTRAVTQAVNQTMVDQPKVPAENRVEAAQ
jgi:hypothetical protein